MTFPNRASINIHNELTFIEQKIVLVFHVIHSYWLGESHATAWLCTSLPFCATSFQLSLLMVNILNYLRKFNLHIAVARCEWANFMSRVPFRFGSPNYRNAKNLHVFSCIFRSLCTFLNWLTLLRHMQFSCYFRMNEVINTKYDIFSICMHWRRWSAQCIG